MIDVTDIDRHPPLATYYRMIKWARQLGLGRFRSLVWLHEKLVSRLTPRIVRFRGFCFETDPRNAWGPAFIEMHKPEIDFLLPRVRPGDVVIDVGANVGVLTVLLASRVGPLGHVYALEPESRNAAMLRRNVRRNGLSNVSVVQKAASDASGWRTLYRSMTNNELHRMQPSSFCRETVAVECVSLDDLLAAEHRPVAWIKVDVEGHEHRVLRGMRRCLERNPCAQLFLEFNEQSLREAGIAPSALLQLLVDHEFCLVDAHAAPLISSPPETLLSRYQPGAGKATNLWCCRTTPLPPIPHEAVKGRSIHAGAP